MSHGTPSRRGRACPAPTTSIAVAVIVSVTALAIAPAVAQQTPQTPPPPVFHSSVDLVHFDVSVLDKERHPVRGLTAADFTILEDGKPQSIVAFSAVDVTPPAPRPTATWMREVSPDVRSNEPEQNPEGRLFVILIDDALLPADIWMLKSAKKIARGVVERLSPSDQVAVVFTFQSLHSVDFTIDRAKLLAAIETTQFNTASHLLGWETAAPQGRGAGGKPIPVMDGDIQLRQGSLRTLRNVAETLIAAPQRRKALVFISPGITVDLVSDAIPVRAGFDSSAAIREGNHQLAQDMPDMLRRMQVANVTMYSVDPCGLGGLQTYITQAAAGVAALKPTEMRTFPPPDFNWLAPGSSAYRPQGSDLAQHAATVDMDFLQAAAANTGGRAIVNTNDFDPGLDGIFDENGSYYLLGYRKPEKNAPSSRHRLEVKVSRPGVTVRTRSGYETDAPDAAAKKPKDPPKDPVTTALTTSSAGPVAASALRLDVALAPVAVSGTPGAIVTVMLGLRQPAVTARTAQTIDLQATVYTPDGRKVGVPLRQTAAFTLVPSSGSDVTRYDVLTQVALAPGRYELRIAAHRATDNLDGSVYADVEVPDFAKAPLSMSGVLLEASPGPSPLPRNAFGSVIPIVPTSSRVFAVTDNVAAFFRIYQGGDAPVAPVSIATHVVNDHDVTVADETFTLDADKFFAARAADHRFVLPLAKRSAGRYLLSVETTMGKITARRDVVFTIG